MIELTLAEREPLLDLYRERFGGLPTVSKVLRALPDPADHPIFRITTKVSLPDQYDRVDSMREYKHRH